jgi:hypothetical protein
VKVVEAIKPLASVTCIVISAEPGAVGVPEILPVFSSRTNPACKVPVVIANAYGSAPLETVKLSEKAVPVVPVMPEVGVVISGVVVID